MKVFEYSTISFAVIGRPNVRMTLRQEVPGRIFYVCECGAYRSGEFDVFADMLDVDLTEMQSHVLYGHQPDLIPGNKG